MKRLIRRFIPAVLILAVLLGLAGCGQKSTGDPVLDAALSSEKYLYKLAGVQYGCEWLAVALNGWDLGEKDTWREEYYKSAAQAAIDGGGIFNSRKYTDQASRILGLTAAGFDVTDVEGYDLTLPLADYEKVMLQGMSGAVWSLIALDCGGYEMPENPDASVQATREMYVDYILSRQLPDGGFAFSGEKADVDMTAMTLQALAFYRDRADVQEASDKALECLSTLQNDDGGFSSYAAPGTESCAQVMIALARLGIAVDDPRFVKNGRTILDKMMEYQKKDGSFIHSEGGEADAMSTEQGLLALVTCLRQRAGMPDVYTMR